MKSLYIYVASSWRNTRQPEVIAALRADGHEVYDFKNPEPGDQGFSWKEIDEDPSWLQDPVRFRDRVLHHPVATRGFLLDMGALRLCDLCVLVMPCGRSAHLELGWCAGADIPTVVLLDSPLSEPELMWRMCSHICVTLEEVRLVARNQARFHAAASEPRGL